MRGEGPGQNSSTRVSKQFEFALEGPPIGSVPSAFGRLLGSEHRLQDVVSPLEFLEQLALPRNLDPIRLKPFGEFSEQFRGARFAQPKMDLGRSGIAE
jgi:hypothetical protein